MDRLSREVMRYKLNAANFIVLLPVMLTLSVGTNSVAAQGAYAWPCEGNNALSRREVKHDTSPPLRTIPPKKIPTLNPQEDQWVHSLINRPIQKNGYRPGASLPQLTGGVADLTGPLSNSFSAFWQKLSDTLAAPMPNPTYSFDGNSQASNISAGLSAVVPPDTEGAIVAWLIIFRYT